jgi:hypothetical protein
VGPGVGGRGTAFNRRGGSFAAGGAALAAVFFAAGTAFRVAGVAFFFCTVTAFFFVAGAAFLVAGVAFFFCTVTAFFFTGVLRAGFTDRVWRVAAAPADRDRAFAADFTGRVAFRFTGFAARVGRADLR